MLVKPGDSLMIYNNPQILQCNQNNTIYSKDLHTLDHCMRNNILNQVTQLLKSFFWNIHDSFLFSFYFFIIIKYNFLKIVVQVHLSLFSPHRDSPPTLEPTPLGLVHESFIHAP